MELFFDYGEGRCLRGAGWTTKMKKKMECEVA